MLILNGKGVFGGIAIGKISYYRHSDICAEQYHVEDTLSEIRRFQLAVQKGIKELEALFERALGEVKTHRFLRFTR
nr:phosphoenolpyruvate-utilizing N-terminal domain-containing protein [uncultured Caproiciproducens sp.]